MQDPEPKPERAERADNDADAMTDTDVIESLIDRQLESQMFQEYPEAQDHFGDWDVPSLLDMLFPPTATASRSVWPTRAKREVKP